MEDKKEKGKAGRPRAKIDLELLEKLAVIHCSPQEMANLLGIHRTTLLKNDDYAEIIARGMAEGKKSLRRKQMEIAMGGNPTMLIWLGKNMLGQSDNPLGEADEKVLPWTDDF